MKSRLLLACVLMLAGGFANGFSSLRPQPSMARPLSSARNLFSTPSSSSTCSHQGSVNNRHSASDWLYNIRSIPNSTILREVQSPVLAVAAWSAVVAVVHSFAKRSTSTMLQALATKMCIPGTAHSFLVSALSLLLVFRTNSAYQRFYEGRKIWEDILSISRNFSRMIQLYSKEVGGTRQERLLNLIAAYPYLLRHHIRSGCLCAKSKKDIHPPEFRFKLHEPMAARLETRYEGDKLATESTKPRSCWVDRRDLPWSLFESRALSHLARSPNRPLWAADRLGKEIMGVPYGPNFTSRERLTMLGQVDKLTNAIGQCERIHQTAVPLNYARHSLRSLTIWLFTLPFCLVKDLGLLTPLVTGLASWTLLGIYQISQSIEDPFQGSLRLSALCDAIRADVLGMDAQSRRDSAYQADDDWGDFDDLEPIIVQPSSEDLLANPPKFVLERNGSWDVIPSSLRG